jgi:hypothetical protein
MYIIYALGLSIISLLAMVITLVNPRSAGGLKEFDSSAFYNTEKR